MKIGQRGLGEHIQFLAPLFGLIAAVWALRLVLAIVHAPHFIIHYCSVTAAGSISILFAVLMIYFKKFGGYANVAASAVLLHFWEQLLISAAIAFDMLAGTRNVYSAPEFAQRMTPLQHLLSHLTIVLAFGSLVGTAMGCLLLWMLRKLVPPETIDKRGR
jgi:hypothetical protein